MGTREERAREEKRENASEWMVASINETVILKHDSWKMFYNWKVAGHERPNREVLVQG